MSIIIGTEGSDDHVLVPGSTSLRGTLDADVISGLAGNDRIFGSEGSDQIDGGADSDRLIFNLFNTNFFTVTTGSRSFTVTADHISDGGPIATSFTAIERVILNTTGTGDYGDTIDASTGPAVNLFLGDGNDIVTTGAGEDYIETGLGSNSIDTGDNFDLVRAQFDNGAGQLLVTGSNGLVIATAGDGTINTIVNAEQIQLFGVVSATGTTTVDASGLTGFGGQLIFWDNDGSNISIGSSGSDIFANLAGYEAGTDVYTGNGGADIYDYTWAVSAMNGDTITDFDADDIIDLQFNDASQNGGGYIANQFIGTAAFTGVAGQYRFDVDVDQGFTYLQVDTDGDGNADETLTITNGNFALQETWGGSNQLVLAGLSGGAGDDFLEGTNGDEIIFGQGGDDTIAATQGIDRTDGGDGTDQLRFILSNANRFDAATGSRTFVVDSTTVTDSTGLINTTFSYFESIFINALGTGDHGDIFDGSTAAQQLIIRAGHGDDTLLGGSGNDDLSTGLGINIVDAGGGYDLVRAQFDNSGGATAYVTLQDGAVVTTLNDVVVNSATNAEQVGIIGFDFNAGATVDASGLVGYDGMLVFWDNNGSNYSIGHDGTDVFANVFEGVVGTDVYTGNGGADIYDYTWAVSAMDGDTITDFDADDIIDLQFNDASQNGGGYIANQFIGTAAFTGVAGQYRYEASGGQTFLRVDTNGDGVADESLTISNGQFALGETSPGSNLLKIIGLSGTSGVDSMTGTLGDDRLYGQAGNDIFDGSQGNDYIDGGAGGGDRLHFLTGNAAQFTTATGGRTYTIGANSITDSSGALNTSFLGVERINLSTVGNGDFDDTIDASGFVSGHSAAIDIRLGDGDNTIIGSGGNDRVFTGFGSNSASGGEGYDYALINVAATSAVTITITNASGNLVTDADGVINHFGGFEEIWVQGVGAGAVTLDASAYTDIAGLLLVLVGHNGSDIMLGSAGTDLFANITGQVLGSDVYTGNGGSDIYDYTWAADSMNGDTITDFDTDDVIDLRFNSLDPGGSPVRADHFIGAEQFSGVAGEYRYQINGTETVVQVDSDGDKIVDQTLTISNGAFILSETFAGSNILTMATAIEEVEGIVADGYLADATVFVDTDGDQILDDGEAWTTTDAEGNFTLNVNYDGTLVAFGGTNIDTGLANTMTLAAPDGSGVVNPLTTLVQALVDAGNSSADAEAMVLDALGLDPELDLLHLDLIAAAESDSSALEAQKAAAMVANLVTTAKSAEGAGEGTETLLVDALAGLVAGGGTVNLTDVDTLTPLLEVALPGTDVSAIANETAFESTAIAEADSLGEISAAQVDAFAFNHLAGGSGSDTLTGTTGRDRIVGGDGKDFLRGGGGDDVFIAENTASKVPTKAGDLSIDVIFDFGVGDKIDVSAIDANGSKAGHQDFSWKGTSANKAAGDLSYKTYTSVQGAEKAIGFDIDGVDGNSPFTGPVTVVYGNVDGGSPDFAMVLIGTASVSTGDFIFA